MEKISTDKMVTIDYRMTSHLLDGTIKEHTPERISFIFGVDRQVPTLEKALEGSQVGQVHHLSIPAFEIYGEHDPELIREVPKKGLIKQRLQVGQYYRQMKKGTLVSFKVLEIKDDTVVADFNRPMAGIRLSMDVDVLDIRDATEKEIASAMESQMKRSIGCG